MQHTSCVLFLCIRSASFFPIKVKGHISLTLQCCNVTHALAVKYHYQDQPHVSEMTLHCWFYGGRMVHLISFHCTWSAWSAMKLTLTLSWSHQEYHSASKIVWISPPNHHLWVKHYLSIAITQPPLIGRATVEPTIRECSGRRWASNVGPTSICRAADVGPTLSWRQANVYTNIFRHFERLFANLLPNFNQPLVADIII